MKSLLAILMFLTSCTRSPDFNGRYHSVLPSEKADAAISKTGDGIILGEVNFTQPGKHRIKFLAHASGSKLVDLVLEETEGNCLGPGSADLELKDGMLSGHVVLSKCPGQEIGIQFKKVE